MSPLRARCLVPLLTLPLLGCRGGILEPAGRIAAAEQLILVDSTVIMLAIVVPVIVATLAFAWWFRDSNARARRHPDFVFSGQLEGLIWGIPALVVVFVGGIAWVGSHALDPAKPLASSRPPLVIEVVSLDWKWLFIMPELGVASVNRLVVPAGRPLAFRLTSASVMNAFQVPQLGTQIYTMPGMATRLNLIADAPGRFEGLSQHFSGDGFPAMRFPVDALPPPAFDRWAVTARALPPLDIDGYARLARQGVSAARDYGGVPAGLFAAVVDGRAPAASGPPDRSPRQQHSAAPDA